MTSNVSAPHFFVVGVSRSGTTLLRAMLSGHPAIVVPPESMFAWKLFRHFGDRVCGADVLAQLDADPKFREWGVDARLLGLRPDQQQSTVDVISAVYEAYRRSSGKTICGDKNPSYCQHIEFLAARFPTARFIHIVRDGRAVAASLLRMKWWNRDPVRTGWYWSRLVLRAHAAVEALTDRCLEVRYEDLVTRPESVLREICGFLGVTFTTSMLDYPGAARRLIPKDQWSYHTRLEVPPTPERVSAWRADLSSSTGSLIAGIEATALRRLGYTLEHERPLAFATGRVLSVALRIVSARHAWASGS